jgi:thiol-disulfide isomerase/thioredoxin
MMSKALRPWNLFMHRPISQSTSLVITLLAVVLALADPGVGQAEEVTNNSGFRQAPKRRIAGDHGVGRYVADVTFSDLSGKPHKLSEFAGKKATVVAMTSTSCPLSQKFLPSLAELARQFATRGVAFVLVNPIDSDRMVDLQAAEKSLDGQALYVWDKEQKLAAAVGAETTTDVIVLDASRTVVYHGCVDDQYGIGYALDAPRHRYLGDALEALLAGRSNFVAATEAPGCLLDLEQESAAAGSISYHNRISRLLQRHCVECHREGGVAPFALTSYKDVVSHAPMIRQVVESAIMPPWFAAPHEGRASPWANDRSLSADEKSDLLGWIAEGKAEGDPRDAPQPRTFAEGWLIGKPDAVFEFAQPVAVKATGTMPYQNVVVETHLSEEKWVQAIEVRPGARQVVHHVLVFARGESDSGATRDEAADERMGYWGIYVPGNSTLVYPEGYAKRLPKGAKFRFQVHYTPNGTATEDVTRIGLVFAKQPPRHEVHVAGIVNTRLNIPPGAEDHREAATLRVPFDVQVLAFLPHMHLRGKAARYEVTRGDGQPQTLLDIPRYDFNWQLLYRYAEPLALARGDTIKFTAWYDNSEKNPANPDPAKTVRWGPQTFDEMQLGYVEYIVAGAGPTEAGETERRFAFGVLDKDGDGALSKEELRQIAESSPRLKDNLALLDVIFQRLDADGSGKLERNELGRLRELLTQRP